MNLICPHQTTSVAEGPWSIRPAPHHRSRLSIYSTMMASTDEKKITNKITKHKQKQLGLFATSVSQKVKQSNASASCEQITY